MKAWRTLIITAVLAALALGLAGWAWMTARAPLTVKGRGEALLPALANKAAAVAEIVVQRGERQLRLRRRKDGRWVAAGSGWPVEKEQVRSVLLTLSEMRKVQPATANPARYRIIYVDMPNPNSLATRLLLKDASGKVLADVILGKEAPDWLGSGREAQFVRLSGERRAWLVEGRVRAPVTITGWADDRLLSLPLEAVDEVVIGHADGETLTLVANRAAAGDGEDKPQIPDIPLTLKDMPAGAKPNATHIRQLFYSIVDLTFTDVRKAKSEGKPLATLTVKTTDGLVISFAVLKDERGYWLRPKLVKAGKDEKRAQALRKRFDEREFAVYDSVGEAFSFGLGDLIEAEKADLSKSQAPAAGERERAASPGAQ